MNVERILSRAIRNKDGDLIWQGPLNNNGYASLGGKLVHRLVYEHFCGPIPDGHDIDHVWEKGCRSRACIDPDHLEAVEHAENMKRGVWSRQTHCKNGHRFTPKTTYINPSGRRACKVCRREALRRHRQAKAGIS